MLYLMKKTSAALATALAVFCAVNGCSMFGVSIKTLEAVKAKESKTFNKSVSECYAASIEGLTKWNITVDEKKKDRYIVASNFNKMFAACINTTSVGIFFKETSPGITQVEVSSMNYNLSGLVARKLFAYIENP
jgi:hypothetical protein